MKIPTPDELLVNPSTSFWLKDAIRQALRRDPVDALDDAETLAACLFYHLHPKRRE